MTLALNWMFFCRVQVKDLARSDDNFLLHIMSLVNSGNYCLFSVSLGYKSSVYLWHQFLVCFMFSIFCRLWNLSLSLWLQSMCYVKAYGRQCLCLFSHLSVFFRVWRLCLFLWLSYMCSRDRWHGHFYIYFDIFTVFQGMKPEFIFVAEVHIA